MRDDQPVGNVLKPNTSKSSLPVKAFCHLRGGGGGRGEVSSSMVKYSEIQEKLKIQVTFAVACASIFYIRVCTKF